MKDIYESLVIEVVSFEKVDVIVTSDSTPSQQL